MTMVVLRTVLLVALAVLALAIDRADREVCRPTITWPDGDSAPAKRGPVVCWIP